MNYRRNTTMMNSNLQVALKKRRMLSARKVRRRDKGCIDLLAAFLIAMCLALPMAFGNEDTQSAEPIIGIDLGTTYSCVGYYKDGSVEIIPNDQGNRITPSYVAFTENERLVGDAAKNQATINPENTIFDVKRLIGRHYSDPSVQADKKLVPYKVVSENNKPRISVTQNGKEATYAPEELSAMVLSKMKKTAEDYLGQPVSRAVITVPAYFNDEQRQATKDAGQIAGLEVLRVINEPTAASIAYGIDRDMDDANVLVFDLGGGTFDVTLLNMDAGVFEVLASHGDTHLGGEDFDQRIMQYFIKKIKKADNIDISGNKRALQKLRKEVERVKRALSSQTQARVEIEDLIPGYDFQETLTRARFEELNIDLFKKTLNHVQEVLDRAKIHKNEVGQIVLVGGSTRIPKVQEILSDFFDGKELSKGINPDEAVAFGAAVQAAILGGVVTGKDEELILMDKTSLSKGIETVGGVFTKIIPRDTTIPAKKTQTFSTNSDNQSRVMIDVYEGERTMTRDNHHLGKFELNGIAPAPRGVPQIDVTFEVDANGILQVSAADRGTGRSESITITADKGRLSEEDIKRMIQEAKAFKEEDTMIKERIDARNGLESYLYNLKNSIDGNTDNVDTQDKRELLDNIDEALDWMDSNPEATKEEFEDKQKHIEHLANPIMRQLYSRGGSASNEGDFYDDDL